MRSSGLVSLITLAIEIHPVPSEVSLITQSCGGVTQFKNVFANLFEK